MFVYVKIQQLIPDMFFVLYDYHNKFMTKNFKTNKMIYSAILGTLKYVNIWIKLDGASQQNDKKTNELHF